MLFKFQINEFVVKFFSCSDAACSQSHRKVARAQILWQMSEASASDQDADRGDQRQQSL